MFLGKIRFWVASEKNSDVRFAAMGTREVDALLAQVLGGAQLTPEMRRYIDAVLAQPTLDQQTMNVFTSYAFVMARAASRGDPQMRAAMAWFHHLWGTAMPELVAPPPPPPPPMPAVAPAKSSGSKAENPQKTLAEAYFSPGDACLRAIRAQFEKAKRSVDICVFTITDDRISSAIMAAKERGIQLRVLTDDDKSRDEGSDISKLERAGIDVRRDNSPAHMHHKFALFDGERLLTGSFNWTRGATDANEENLLITDEPRLVSAFAQRFQSLWEKFSRT